MNFCRQLAICAVLTVVATATAFMFPNMGSFWAVLLGGVPMPLSATIEYAIAMLERGA